MRIADMMNRSVVTGTKRQTVADVAKVMVKKAVGSVVVEEKGKPIGIVTERDIMEAVAKGKDLDKTTAGGIMTQPVITTSSTMELDEAVKLMVLYNIKKLPVVDEGELVGIVTLTDFARYEPLLHDMMRKALRRASEAAKKRFEPYIGRKEPPAGMYG